MVIKTDIMYQDPTNRLPHLSNGATEECQISEATELAAPGLETRVNLLPTATTSLLN